MITQFDDPAEAQAWCRAQRRAHRRLGFVPTMGGIHEGHLSLVRQAAADNDVCCSSIFVNPLQFNDRRDFERYPRNMDEDVRQLESAGCDMVFSGSLDDFFAGNDPYGRDVERIDPGRFGGAPEGHARPSHFAGVSTIVKRLFEIVQPDRAYFGEKDFQQSLVVGELAARLGYPEVIVCPTVREASGVALSSRNALLDARQKHIARALFEALSLARERWQRGDRNPRKLSDLMNNHIADAGAIPEYAEIRDAHDWTTPDHDSAHRIQGVVAAKVGEVRLIDTLRFDGSAPSDQD